ncbi:hypothetical protein K1T71_002224 [Dendrolimus kikuchii]|uniref:Uncharacterized protein n=1 Tax=Dendrolimus kikuchii TaxID=765133 RepID=A0ACC1DG94_9NEOP|nr:hypothetical protein K1T71_002224 [Dendrolimus kikuchii]
MQSLFTYILEAKKEMLIGFSLSILYITYYLSEVVKRPVVVCGEETFRTLLEERVPLLREPYWPTPWCVEARLQTVIGSLLRSRLLTPLTCTREIVVLSDGGQVALDWVETGVGCEASAPVLLVLPGLTGSAGADYVRCLAAAARELRARCVLTTPRLYCALSHEDLAEVVAWVGARCGGAPLLAAGVSLGGLILGQYLAAHGARARVHAALAVSSPLDVERGSECMERPPLNSLLSYHMARQLRQTVRAHAPLRAEWGAVARARSVREFDAAFTTRHFGFGSVEAYYRAASLRDKLGAVAGPLLCLCAADDPFQPLEALPLREALAAGAGGARVALALTARGGHIGFLEGWWPARPAHTQYIARLAAQYFAALLAAPHLLHRPPAAPAPH